MDGENQSKPQDFFIWEHKLGDEYQYHDNTSVSVDLKKQQRGTSGEDQNKMKHDINLFDGLLVFSTRTETRRTGEGERTRELGNETNRRSDQSLNGGKRVELDNRTAVPLPANTYCSICT